MKKMRNFPIAKIFMMLFMMAISSLSFAGESSVKRELESLNKVTVVVYDEIVIDRPIQVVWSKLFRFPFWYFERAQFETISGEPYKVGYTLVMNNSLALSVVSARPFQSVVWKTCFIECCDKKYNFTDFTVREVNGKTLLGRSLYSQGGFWPKATVAEFHRAQAQGKVPEAIRKTSLAFKSYLETE